MNNLSVCHAPMLVYRISNCHRQRDNREDETDHDIAVRIWSGQYSVDKVEAFAKKDF
ncbi:hypothetical protein [Proteiniphilum acetatigenes]|uniref:hypothetical protein n=1 Tax=Proteiniphilum acetatigenes TaxID=294710 RepID=UPI0003A3EFE3|nr:hypothetical protein [Proteiniphilum acetatigenes]